MKLLIIEPLLVVNYTTLLQVTIAYCETKVWVVLI